MKFSITQYFVFSTALFFAFQTAAQNAHGTGLKRNDAAYEKVQMLPRRGVGEKSAAPILPRRIGLRPFCPTPGDQYSTSSCVGWAASYAALTISQARRDRLTDRDIINRRACSPFFVFNKSGYCDSGGDMLAAMKILEKDGTCYAQTFGKDTTFCGVEPDDRANGEAKSLRIKDYARLFKIGDSEMEKVRKIKDCLADSIPVIIGVELTDSFNLYGQKWWTPDDDAAPKNANFHALVVVGYDESDKSFDLMNSWGETWGDGGFIRVPMAQLVKKTFYAYQITIDGGILRGGFFFKKWENDTFKNVAVRFDKKTKTYQTEQKTWRIGDIFQLVANGVPQGKYLYVFSFNTDGKAAMHFGAGKNVDTTDNILPTDNLDIVVPSVESALKISQKQEFLCILFSDNDISSELADKLENLKKPNHNVQKRLAEVFSNWLVNNNRVHFEDRKMAFYVRSPHEKGDAVALILSIKAQ